MAEKEHVGPVALQNQAGMYNPVASSRFVYLNAKSREVSIGCRFL